MEKQIFKKKYFARMKKVKLVEKEFLKPSKRSKQLSECEVKLGEHISIIKGFDQKSSVFSEKYQNQRLKWQ